MNTQAEDMLAHMMEHGSITRLEAFVDYGIFEAPARIVELKKRGYNISTSYEYGKNRKGKPIKWARWTLI